MMHALYRRRLSAYLDGALTGRALRGVERHLRRCDACRGELAELRGTVALLKSLATNDPEPSEFLATRVLARIEAGEAAPSAWDRARETARGLLAGPWAPALSAVAVLFVVATALRVQIQVRIPEAEAPLPTANAPAAPAPTLEVSHAPGLALAPLPPEGRRRFEPVTLGFEPVVLEQASGVQRACAASPHDADCAAFRNKLVNLALGDPPDFVREIESFPLESQDRVLHAVSREAERTGHAQRVIRGLRGVDDPRAYGIVIRFQRTIASRE